MYPSALFLLLLLLRKEEARALAIAADRLKVLLSLRMDGTRAII